MFSASLGKVRSNILKKNKNNNKVFFYKRCGAKVSVETTIYIRLVECYYPPYRYKRTKLFVSTFGQRLQSSYTNIYFSIIVQVLFTYFSPRDARTAGRSVNYQIATIIVFVFLFSWLYCNSPPG